MERRSRASASAVWPARARCWSRTHDPLSLQISIISAMVASMPKGREGRGQQQEGDRIIEGVALGPEHAGDRGWIGRDEALATYDQRARGRAC